MAELRFEKIQNYHADTVLSYHYFKLSIWLLA